MTQLWVDMGEIWVNIIEIIKAILKTTYYDSKCTLCHWVTMM